MRFQPMLAVTSPVRGMLLINGRFAGAISAERPFFAPVNPSGPAYLALLPLDAGRLPMARRVEYVRGEFVPESAEAEGVSVVLWPGGVAEIELAPAAEPGPERVFRALDDRGAALLRRGGAGAVRFPGGAELPLPDWTGEPELIRAEGGVCLLGERAEGGMFLAAADESGALLGMLQADRIEREGEDGFSALACAGDTVGHARLERWRLRPEGLEMLSWEPAWAGGAPRWPGSPEETVLAAMEAAAAGLEGEAQGYLAPGMRLEALLDAAKACDACAAMKYPPGDGRACVAAIRLLSERCARVAPLYFSARKDRGTQGPWRIEALEWS